MADLFIIAAPSGCGKTSLVDALLKKSCNICVSVSHTTRKPRPEEVDGTNYHFISVNEFQEMIKDNKFVEFAEVFENLYGSSRQLINENNLNLFEESSQKYLKDQMEKYFFSDDDLDKIQGYIPK